MSLVFNNLYNSAHCPVIVTADNTLISLITQQQSIIPPDASLQEVIYYGPLEPQVMNKYAIKGSALGNEDPVSNILKPTKKTATHEAHDTMWNFLSFNPSSQVTMWKQKQASAKNVSFEFLQKVRKSVVERSIRWKNMNANKNGEYPLFLTAHPKYGMQGITQIAFWNQLLAFENALKRFVGSIHSRNVHVCFLSVFLII